MLSALLLVSCIFIDKATLDARLDMDDDGSPYPDDCGPDDPGVFPGAPETCDGVDQDCDGEIDEDSTDAQTWYADVDGDGSGDLAHPTTACTQPTGTVTSGDDCDDTDPAFHPGADESDCSDSHDYNCDGSVGGDDADGDGFVACDDCDDTDTNVNPDADEVCNNLDDDCDGTTDTDANDIQTWYPDADGDGFGSEESVTVCEAPEGFVANNADCDDTSGAVHPGANETCNDLDDDCDAEIDEDALDATLWYADLDGDGYGAGDGTASCSQPEESSPYDTDCDDTDAAYNPAAYESVCRRRRRRIWLRHRRGRLRSARRLRVRARGL